MAPLIDVVFQLLIFFMLSSSFFRPALKLDLPQAVEQDHREPERIVVSVDREGKIFVNAMPVSMTGLQAHLAKQLQGDPKKAIHLQGDQAMAYRLFVEVMDRARQAGVRHIHLVHESTKQ